MSSRVYWATREAEQLRHNQKEEKAYMKEVEKIHRTMLDEVQKEIDSFYGRYASKEGITIAEAKKRVSELDIKRYERKAKRYVKEKDFSKEANEEMRLYNLTMKINRLEMLKANIGLELIAGHNAEQKLMEEILQGRTEAELARQAGILGKTVRDNAKKAHAIVNASFQNGTFSDRIWANQVMLRSQIASLLQTGLIQGKNPRELARSLKKTFDTSTYNAERLMRTELARVQTEAQKQSFIRNGFEEYTFHSLSEGSGTCPICLGLDGKHFKIKYMMPGTNAPPMHPNCRCSTSAYEDSDDYEAWLDHLANGGTTESWNKTSKMASETDTGSDWSGTISRTVSKEEKAEIIKYARSKGINIADLSKFDGDADLLKSAIDELSRLATKYPVTKRKLTIAVSNLLDDEDFADTHNRVISINAKALRNREITERNINATKNQFASVKFEDIIAHEYGHIIASVKGNRGIEFAQKAYYNIYKEEIGIDEIIEFLQEEISIYSTTYKDTDENKQIKFNVKKYDEVTSEIFAKNEAEPSEFTKEYIRILEGGIEQ